MSLCEGGVSSPLGTGTHSLCSPARWAATRLRLWGLRTLGSGWGPGGRLGKAAVEKPQPQHRAEGGPGGSSSAHQALPPVLPDGEKGAATSLCLTEETEASDGPRRPLGELLEASVLLPSVSPLCVPPSACALSNSQDTGLGTKSSRSSGWPGGGHAARPGGPRATIPTHTAAKAGTRLNTGPTLAL